MHARIVAVCAKSTADGSMRKPLLEQVTLRAGWGVEGDLHAGRRPARQVLLMSRELLDDFAAEDMPVAPGDMARTC